MDVKRFVGRDVRTALRLVREQMGPDAMILSNTRTAEGVEVVAAPFEVVNSLSKGPKGVLRDLGKVPDETGRRPLVALASGPNPRHAAEAPGQGEAGSLRDDIVSVGKAHVKNESDLLVRPFLLDRAKSGSPVETPLQYRLTVGGCRDE